ncbi:MAG TPA: hypothetical protein VLD39_16855, partial [Gammaproteobacteria bacterium]|nr:hypothetical protein [Gammaproteobacteria bacterium]
MAFLTLVALLPSARAATVGIEVREALQSNEYVPVVVELTGLAGSDESGRARIAARRDDVLAGLPGGSFRELRRWAALPGFAGEVSEAGLAAMASHPYVRRVDLDSPGGGTL